MTKARLLLTVFYSLVVVSCSSSSADRGNLRIGAGQLGAAQQGSTQQGSTQQGSTQQGSTQQGSVATFKPVCESPIKVVYPTDSTKVPAASTFIVGSIRAGDKLTCNGTAVRLSPQGYFAHVVSLKPGDNEFELVESGLQQSSRKLVIHRDIDPPLLSENQVQIVAESIQPSESKGIRQGELIEFSLRATPNSQVAVNLGKKWIYLRTLDQAAVSSGKRKKSHAPRPSARVNVNTGMDAAYGQVYQRHSHGRPDHYFGHYKVAADDNWVDLRPKIILKHAGKTIWQICPQSLTVVQQPNLAQTAHDATIVRVGPNASRITPLAGGIRLLVDGWQGDQMSCLYAPGRHVWIARQDLIFENGDEKNSAGQGPTPMGLARTINLKDEPEGECLSLPLSQRLPYQVEQTLNPNCLKLHVFGVTADTDWISDTPERGQLLEGVTWKQIADSHYEITVSLKGRRQWGYRVEYNGTELQLHIKKPPQLASADRLDGLTICLDPGHGGSERGAIGPSGVAEAEVNLGIALNLKELLVAQGAKVIMTRNTDKDVGLDDRVKIADDANVDILLSIHNNSLPDGRDPWTERGSSTYFYHPQSKELARTLKNTLLEACHLPDLGSRYQNLCLCRPTGMPAVLAEVGFMINPEEYTILISPEGQAKAAQGLLIGLESYLGRQANAGSPPHTRSQDDN